MSTTWCRVRTFLAALFFACAIAAPGPVHADHRVALVIGNAAYRYIPALDNSGDDARLIAETPVNANTVREADIDFDMLDTALVLRQMEAAGTRLNLALPWVEQRIGISLAESQIAAMRLALISKVAGHHRRSRRRQDRVSPTRSAITVRSANSRLRSSSHRWWCCARQSHGMSKLPDQILI